MFSVLESINKYYTNKLLEHGPIPAGVDWNSEESQKLRYQQLLKCVDKVDSSLLDYGCGYGALLELMNEQLKSVNYYGFDISTQMLDAARNKFKEQTSVHWVNKVEKTKYDFLVASGLFNVKLEEKDAAWLLYIKNTILEFDKLTKRAFAFNVLTSYSDAPKMKDYLYYANPEELFKFCKENISRNVSLIHDYNLYEFTIIVRKEV